MRCTRSARRRASSRLRIEDCETRLLINSSSFYSKARVWRELARHEREGRWPCVHARATPTAKVAHALQHNRPRVHDCTKTWRNENQTPSRLRWHSAGNHMRTYDKLHYVRSSLRRRTLARHQGRHPYRQIRSYTSSFWERLSPVPIVPAIHSAILPASFAPGKTWFGYRTRLAPPRTA